MATMNRQYIDDHDIVARYLAGQLSDQEREQFEALFAQDPELLKELNKTAQFKAGLIDLKQSGALDRLLKLRPWWQNPKSVAAAASIALLLIGAALWLNTEQQPRPLLAGSISQLSHGLKASVAIAASFRIERTRTSSYDATIKIPNDGAVIELKVKPEVAATPAKYRVAFGAADGSSTNLVALNGLIPDANGFVSVYLNAAGFSPAVYELKISGDVDTSTANTPSSFLIELTNSSE
jgi:hypothetical protein